MYGQGAGQANAWWVSEWTRQDNSTMKVAALAGGVGAGKFLRGLTRIVPGEDLTVVVNTGDDLVVHGLHVSPDVDSVTYWLAGVMDRERGWGRGDESFRATGELQRLDAEGAWFGLGDLDLALHLLRTRLMAGGADLSGATADVARRFGVGARILPMTNDAVATRVEVIDDRGAPSDLHFQEYWVQRGAADQVTAVRYQGAETARPAPGVLEAIGSSEVVVICPSNPIASIDPILAVAGIRPALQARRQRTVAISPIVGGAPLRGMADKLLPVAGEEVTALGVARHYARLAGSFVIDEVDRELVGSVEGLGYRVAATDTIMVDDDAAARLARVALDLATGASSA
jgi:LPPG:FO 2-phospho-L-lactate transferase